MILFVAKARPEPIQGDVMDKQETTMSQTRAPKKTSVKPRRHSRSRARTPEAQRLVIDNIVTAARELFEHEGYNAVNMRAVAAKAGYTVGAIYSYFKTKRQLMVAIWENDTWKSVDAAKAGLKGRSSPQAKVRRVFHSYANYWVENPIQFRNLFGTRDRLEAPGDEYFHQSEVIETLFGVFEKAVSGALESIGAKLDPVDEYLALFNFVQGALDMRLLMGPKHPWPPLRKAVDIAIDGQIARWEKIAREQSDQKTGP